MPLLMPIFTATYRYYIKVKKLITGIAQSGLELQFDLPNPRQFYEPDLPNPRQFFEISIANPRQFFEFDLPNPRQFYEISVSNPRDIYEADMEELST